MNKRKHAAHSLYKAPATTPALTRCLTLHLPDDDEWQLLFESAFSSLMTWINYHRSGTTRESEVAQVWRDIFDALDYGNCNIFEGVSLMPIGVVIPWSGDYDEVPDGWLLCDGTSYLRADYPDLDNVVHRKYGGDATHFNVPDMRARFPVGYNQDGALSEGRTDKAEAQYGGSETVTLTTAQIPSHSHNATQRRGAASANSNSANYAGGDATNPQVSTSTSVEGGGGSHNNLPPFLTFHYIIKWRPDEITGTPGLDGKLTMLRQNATNKYHLEQSYNGGLDWSLAFDYSILKQKLTSPSSDTEINNTYNEINNYLNEVNTAYDNDVLNIYPDAAYDATENDMLRDLTLCWTLRMVGEYLAELLGQLAEDYENRPNLGQVLSAAAEAVFVGGAAAGGFAAALGTVNPVIVALEMFAGALAFKQQLDEFEALWDEYHAEPSGFNDLDIDGLVCCIFDSIQGEMVTETGWKAAFLSCVVPLPDDTIFDEIFKGVYRALAIDDTLFAVWLDLLNAGYQAQQAGVVFDDCPCMVTCETFNFEVDGALSWVPDVNTEFVTGQGFRSIDLDPPHARVTYDLGELAFFKRVEIVWYCPRNTENQYYQIHTSEDNISYTLLQQYAHQPVGKQTDVWTGTSYARYVRVTAIGSSFLAIKGWIYGALFCYIPIS